LNPRIGPKLLIVLKNPWRVIYMPSEYPAHFAKNTDLINNISTSLNLFYEKTIRKKSFSMKINTEIPP
jgi:hypothetical protein